MMVFFHRLEIDGNQKFSSQAGGEGGGEALPDKPIRDVPFLRVSFSA